jgi:4-hydroxy-tetrahydrodipicolinate reductase
VRIVVVGASGRMGARVCALAHREDAFALTGALERAGAPMIGQPAAPAGARGAAPAIAADPSSFAPSSADVVIDFSSDSGSAIAIQAARRTGAALLVGTTALGAQTLAALRDESARRAVLVAPNTSLGVAVAAALARQAAATLAGYDCSIVEAHHTQKKDAPSGTALRLAESARAGGARLAQDQILSIRAGDIIGEHAVRFAGPGEYLEITHRATSRDVFVRGALRAAAWLTGRAPGWYTIDDVLALAAR